MKHLQINFQSTSIPYASPPPPPPFPQKKKKEERKKNLICDSNERISKKMSGYTGADPAFRLCDFTGKRNLTCQTAVTLKHSLHIGLAALERV